MELTPDIVNAIKGACEESGSQVAFAAKTCIKRQNIGRYLNGEIKNITPKLMARLWPHIISFLPKDFSLASDIASEINAEILSRQKVEHNHSIYRLMTKTLYDIDADQLFFRIMIYWVGLSEENRKKAYAEVSKLAENQTKKD